MTQALGILEFLAMSSPSLTGGSLHGILDLGILKFLLCIKNFRIPTIILKSF